MRTIFLSEKEREIAKKYFMLFTLFNGAGFGFLADTTVYLLAIHFNASNFHLGYISSLIHLSGIILILSPKILAGQKITTVYFWAWLSRGLVCLLNGLTLFVNQKVALSIVLLSYTLFCFVRSIGVSLYNPMMQIISTPSTLGNVITHNNAKFNLGNIFAKVASYLISSLPFGSVLYSLLTLQSIGVILNTAGSFFLLKIPCRENIEKNREHNIVSLFFKNIIYKKRIIPLLIHLNYISVMVISGFIIPLLKKQINIPQNTIFLYTVITAITITFSMYNFKSIIDKLPHRPVIILASFFDFTLFIIWAIINKNSSLYLIFILGALGTFIKGINQSMINRTLIASIPQNIKVTYNSMINFFTGIVAFSTGLIGGYLADLGEKINVHFLNSYYLVFIFGAIFSLNIIILSFFISEKEKSSIKEIAELFFSFKNIKTLIDIHNYETTTNPEKRELILMSLKYNSSPIAINEIKKILKDPLNSETEEVLKSLFTKPRPKLIPEILAISKDKGSYHRATAIFALGAYPYPEVEKELISMLDDEDPRIRSTAAKSLARIKNKQYLQKFIELIKNENNSIWEIMNYLIAILSIDEKGLFLKEIFNVSEYKEYSTYKETIFSLVARVLNFSPELNQIYQKEKLEKLSGIKFFLSKTKVLEPFYKENNKIFEYFKNEEYFKIWQWCKKLLNENKFASPYVYLKEGIINFNEKNISKENSIAVLYFTFYILLNSFQ